MFVMAKILKPTWADKHEVDQVLFIRCLRNQTKFERNLNG